LIDGLLWGRLCHPDQETAMKAQVVALCLSLVPLSANAFDVTDPATVTPILDMTRANWVGLRNWEGQELLYFTHLDMWRCAMTAVQYSINGGAMTGWDLLPCQPGTPSPNALPDTYLPFTALPIDHLQTIRIEIKMSDGTVLESEFPRAAILIP
jgi:hypothetical protein